MKRQTPIYLLAIPIINIYHPYKDESHSFYAYADGLQKLPMPFGYQLSPLQVRTFWFHFMQCQASNKVTKQWPVDPICLLYIGDEILPN